MMKPKHFLCGCIRRRMVPLALLLLPLLLLAGPATAAEVRIESSSFAFGGKLVNQSWNAWDVLIQNASDQPVKTNVLLRVDRLGVSAMRQVTIPPQTRYPVRLWLYPDFTPERYESLFKSSKATETLPDGSKKTVTRVNGNLDSIAVLVDPASGKEHTPFKVLLTLAQQRGLHIVQVDDDSGLASGMLPGSGVAIPGDRYLPVSKRNPSPKALVSADLLGGTDDGTALQFSFSPSEKLPVDAAGYDGVGLLTIGSHRPLNSAQKIQLLRWLRAGGRLAVFPVADEQGAAFADSFWREILPVTLLGSREARASDAALYEKVTKARFALDALQPPLLAKAYLKPGAQLLCGTADTVLAARQAVGAGEVYFYALRGGDLQAPKNPAAAYFAGLTAPLTPALSGVTNRFRENAQNLLQSITGRTVPEKWEIAALMGLFLLVGTGLLLVARWKKHAEWGWPLLMGWSVVVFAAASVVMSVSGGGSLSSGEIGVTLLDENSGAGVNRSYAGAFAFEDVKGALSWRQPQALISPLADGDKAESAVVAEDYYPGIAQTRFHPGQFWGLRGLAGTNVGKGIRAQLLFTAGGVRGEVVNNTGLTLENTLIHLNRRVLYLGTLAVGAKVDVANAQEFTFAELARRDFGSGWDVRRNILSQLLFPSDLRVGVNDRPVLIAFTGARFCPYTVSGSAVSSNTRQVIAVLPSLSCGETAVIPEGMTGMVFPSSAGANQVYGYPQRPQPQMPEGTTGAVVSRKPGQPLPPQSATDRARQEALAARAAQMRKPAFDPSYDCSFPAWKEGSGVPRISLRFLPPAGLAGFVPQTATLRLKGQFTGLKAELFVTDSNGKPQRLGEVNESGEGTYQIDKYGSYCGRNGEAPEIEVRTKPVAGAGLASRWKIQDLELRISGKSEGAGQ